MERKTLAAGVLAALMLHACDRAKAPPDPGVAPAATTTDTASAPEAGGPAAAPAASPTGQPPGSGGGSGVNDGYPDLTPPRLTTEAEKGMEGARNVLLSFARALELKEFDQARALLSPGDRQKWSKAAFTRMFADLSEITVAIPDGTTDGACGSIFYTAPITITANDKDGRPVRLEGEAVLRRVNDVDGATPAQLRWHFQTLTLDWTH